MNHQHNWREPFAPLRQAIGDAVKNSAQGPDDGSVRLLGVHFAANYELPLHAEAVDLLHGRSVTGARIWFSADSILLRPT
jgi:hypothetical protein